jgi:protein-tyrosine-phosphatase
MARKCEMCAALKTRVSASEHRPKPVKLRRILIEDRIVALCEPHALKVRQHSPGSIAELRRLFREPRGKRSLLERRAPVDRRIFPARPEGRRARAGRRAGDAA